LVLQLVKNGKCIYTFNVTVNDPDRNDLQRIEIDFGDATSGVILSDWFSGDAIQVSHKWRRTGSYQIKVRVQDAYGAWSDWGYHMILIQRAFFYKDFNLKSFIQNLFA